MAAGGEGLLSAATEAAEAATEKVFTVKEAVSNKLCSVVDGIRRRANAAVAAVTVRVSATVQVVQDTGAAVGGYWEDFRKKGTKAFVLDTASFANEQIRSTYKVLADGTAAKYDAGKKTAVEQATAVAELTKAKASEVSSTVHGIATDPKFQVSAASAASGAVALGTSGGATGLAAGGTLGAAIGLVPALFTFGLSIPIGAAIGGGAGLVVGTAVGGTVGAVGGGAAGYGVYSKKEDIGKCAEYVKTKAEDTTALVKGTAMDAVDFTKAKAYASAEFMAEKASAAKTRLVGRSGTGGTETAD